MRSSKFFILATVAGIICCFSFGAHAQGFYAKLSGSYNVGIGYQNGSNIIVTNTLIDQPNYVWQKTTEAKRVKVNFGKGYTGNVALGYMFTKQLGTEMEVGYLAGGKNNIFHQVIYNPDPDLSQLFTTEMYARMLLFQPSLVSVTNLSENLNLHCKFGIVAAKGIIFMDKYSQSGRGRGTTEMEYTGGLGFGLQGALGFVYQLSEKYELFSEVKMSNLSYTPNAVHLKKEILHGKDVTPDPVVVHELQDSYTTVNSNNVVYLKESYNFSSASLNLGLKLNL